MSKQQLFLGFIFLLLSFSCKDSYEIIDEKLPKGSIRLNLYVQKQVSDNLSLEIIDLYDSRCPVGAVCTDAGMVKVDIRVLSDVGTGTATLFFSEIPNKVQTADTVAGYRIEVVEVTPMPYLNKPIETDSIYSVYVLADKI
jgi:hypothetical protein